MAAVAERPMSSRPIGLWSAIWGIIACVCVPATSVCTAQQAPSRRAPANTDNTAKARALVTEANALALTDSARAVEKVRRAVALAPADPWCRRNLSVFLAGIPGQQDEAVSEARTAWRLAKGSPEQNDYAHNWAMICTIAGRWGEAEDVLRGALRRDPANPLLRCRLGLLLARRHAWWGAVWEQGRAIAALRRYRARVIGVGRDEYTDDDGNTFYGVPSEWRMLESMLAALLAAIFPYLAGGAGVFVVAWLWRRHRKRLVRQGVGRGAEPTDHGAF
jgi:hypothetical protein